MPYIGVGVPPLIQQQFQGILATWILARQQLSLQFVLQREVKSYFNFLAARASRIYSGKSKFTAVILNENEQPINKANKKLPNTNCFPTLFASFSSPI